MEATATHEKASSAGASTTHVHVDAKAHRKATTSSKGSQRLTEIDRRVSKAIRRVTRALDSGIDSYIEHRDKSKVKRRDGAVVDFIENVSYGVSRVVSEASPLIHDAAETLNTRQFRAQIRRVSRSFSGIPFIS